jgi:hypothetical protein
MFKIESTNFWWWHSDLCFYLMIMHPQRCFRHSLLRVPDTVNCPLSDMYGEWGVVSASCMWKAFIETQFSCYFTPFQPFTYFHFLFQSHNTGLCLLGYNIMYYNESRLTFQRNMSLPSSGLKSKPKAKQETSMKQIASRAVRLQKTQVYIGNRRELQDIWLFPMDCLRTRWTSRRHARVTSVSPEKGHLSRSGNRGETSCKSVVGRDLRGEGEKSCVWLAGMWWGIKRVSVVSSSPWPVKDDLGLRTLGV